MKKAWIWLAVLLILCLTALLVVIGQKNEAEQKLRAEIEQSSAIQADLEESLAQAGADIERQQQENEALRAQSQWLESAVDASLERATQVENANTALTVDLNAAQAELEGLQRRLQEALGALASHADALQAARTENGVLSNEVEEKRSEIEDLTIQVENLTENCIVLTAQVEENEAVIAQLCAQAEAFASEKESLIANVEDLNAQAAQNLQEVEFLRSQRDEMAAQVEALSEEHETLSARVTVLTQNAGDLQRQVEALLAQKDALQEQLDTLTEQKAASEQTADALTEANDQLSAMVETLISENAELTALVEITNAEKANLAEMVEILANDYQELIGQVETLTLENQELTVRTQALENANTALEERNLALAEQAEQAAREAEAMRRDMDALRAAAAQSSQESFPAQSVPDGAENTKAPEAGSAPVTVSQNQNVITLGVWTEPDGFECLETRSDPFVRVYTLPENEEIRSATVEALPGPVEALLAQESGLPITWQDDTGSHTCLIQDVPGEDPSGVSRTLKCLVPAGQGVLRVSVQCRPLPAAQLPTPERLLDTAASLLASFNPEF